MERRVSRKTVSVMTKRSCPTTFATILEEISEIYTRH